MRDQPHLARQLRRGESPIRLRQLRFADEGASRPRGGEVAPRAVERAHLPPLLCECLAQVRTDQPGGAGDEDCAHRRRSVTARATPQPDESMEKFIRTVWAADLQFVHFAGALRPDMLTLQPRGSRRTCKVSTHS